MVGADASAGTQPVARWVKNAKVPLGERENKKPGNRMVSQERMLANAEENADTREAEDSLRPF